MSALLNRRIGCALLLLAALSGCNVKSKLNSDTTAPATSTASTENGIATRVLDAADTDAWVYFNLTDNAVVYPAQPQNSREWDIAFERFKIKVNGGVSGSGGVRVAALQHTAFDSVEEVPASTVYYPDRALADLSDSELNALAGNLFFAVCATGFTCIDNGVVDRTHLNADTAAYAFLTLGSGLMYQGDTQTPILGWYDYFFDDNHRLAPAADTWLIETVSGIDIKFEMLGYYGLTSSSEAGNMAFRYQSLTPGFTVPDAGAGQLEADIAAAPASGTAPLPVQFSAAVSGGTATQWHWTFGDGDSGDGAAISHTYAAAGTYVATLNVTDQRGAQTSQAVTITVYAPGNQPPVADAGTDINIMLDAAATQTQVTLDGSGSTDADGVIVSYQWRGSPQPNDEIAPVVTLGIGRYLFTLTVTDNAGASASDTVEVSVASPSNTPPVARIAATPASGGAPLVVQFDGGGSSDSDGSIVGYRWDFGDGASSTSAAPLHTYAQPGQYTATLTVTDDGGAIATATQTLDATLIVAPSANAVVYEFLGNLYDPASPYSALYASTQPLLVYAHESNHAMKALLDFDALDARLSTLSAGQFKATLNLYITCPRGAGGFVDGCPGDPDADGPGGVATVTTDIRAQNGPWQETEAYSALTWSAVQEGTQYASFTVDHTGYWISVDVTALVEAWRAAGSTGDGIVLTQQAYPVVRSDDDNIAVLAIESRASAQTDARPYLEIHKSDPE